LLAKKLANMERGKGAENGPVAVHEGNETPDTRAYEHALDLAYMFVDEMDRQGLSKKELADRMEVSQSRLSNLLNTQPNMTLETIAQFELALGVSASFGLKER